MPSRSKEAICPEGPWRCGSGRPCLWGLCFLRSLSSHTSLWLEDCTGRPWDQILEAQTGHRDPWSWSVWHSDTDKCLSQSLGTPGQRQPHAALRTLECQPNICWASSIQAYQGDVSTMSSVEMTGILCLKLHALYPEYQGTCPSVLKKTVSHLLYLITSAGHTGEHTLISWNSSTNTTFRVYLELDKQSMRHTPWDTLPGNSLTLRNGGGELTIPVSSSSSFSTTDSNALVGFLVSKWSYLKCQF